MQCRSKRNAGPMMSLPPLFQKARVYKTGLQGLQQLASIHIRLDPPVSGCCGQLASQLGGCFERRCNKSISLVWGGVYSCLQGGWCFRIHKPQASTSIQLGYCCIYNVNVYCFDCSHISCRQVRCESGALNRGINSRIQTCWVENTSL